MKSKSSPTLKKIQDDLKEVYKTVYQGNGKPALVTQLSELTGKLKSHSEHVEMKLMHVDEKIDGLEREIELKFKNITDVVTEKFNNISVQITSEFGRKRSETANIWNFKTALTTGLLASCTSVFVILLAEVLKRLNS
jgi:hypothetical protein